MLIEGTNFISSIRPISRELVVQAGFPYLIWPVQFFQYVPGLDATPHIYYKLANQQVSA